MKYILLDFAWHARSSNATGPMPCFDLSKCIIIRSAAILLSRLLRPGTTTKHATNYRRQAPRTRGYCLYNLRPDGGYSAGLLTVGAETSISLPCETTYLSVHIHILAYLSTLRLYLKEKEPTNQKSDCTTTVVELEYRALQLYEYSYIFPRLLPMYCALKRGMLRLTAQFSGQSDESGPGNILR